VVGEEGTKLQERSFHLNCDGEMARERVSFTAGANQKTALESLSPVVVDYSLAVLCYSLRALEDLMVSL
jgi:hypothetical protein